MGRKSSDGNSSSSSTVGATATVMGLRMIQCGRQTVDVIQPDGQVRQIVLPVKVADLLLLYPHHFVSHATTTSATAAAAAAKRGSASASSSSSSSTMLPSDAYLETGSIYVVLPLPRLFPLAPPPTPHLCSCFYSLLRAAEESTSGFGGAIKAEFKRHWPVGTASSSSRISPEDSGSRIGSSSPSPPLPRRLWEPALEIISEDRVLVLSNNASASSKDHDCSAKENQMAKKLVSVLNLNKFRSPPAAPPSSSTSSSSSPSSSSTTAA